MDQARNLTAHFAAFGEVVLVTPNGTENGDDAWLAGAWQVVEWTWVGSVGTSLDLEYSLTGIDSPMWTNIATVPRGASGGGTYWWMTPEVLLETNVFVRVKDAGDTNINDVSDAAFTLVQRFRVVEPNGGEKWYIGAVKAVAWASPWNTSGVARIAYAADGVNYDHVVSTDATSVAGVSTNEYAWAIPSTNASLLSETARVRVINPNGSLADASDTVFTMAGVIVHSPTNGAGLQPGTSHLVEWSSMGAGTNVAIELSLDGGTNFSHTIDPNAPNQTGSTNYLWTVTAPATGNAVIRIRSLTDTNVVGYSSAFAIGSVQLTVQSDHGTAMPDGTNAYDYGTEVACAVAGSPVLDDGTRHTCTGWVGSGSAPASGGATNVSFTITNDSELTWQWLTEHELSIGVMGYGSVGVAGGWYTNGTEHSMLATPSNGWFFSRWSGDVPGGSETNNPLALTMDQGRSVTGHFERVDGLLGEWLFDEGAGETASDTSGMGHHGFLTNITPASAWGAGRLSFGEAAGSRVVVPRPAYLDTFGSFTVQTRVRWRGHHDAEGDAPISVWGSDWSADDEWSIIVLGNSHYDFQVRDDGSTALHTASSGQVLATNTWHTLTAIFEAGQSLSLYLDETLLGTGVVAQTGMRDSGMPLTIGNRAEPFGPQSPFNGDIDMVRIWRGVHLPATSELVVDGAPAPHGTPTPYGYGTNVIATGKAVSVTVDSPADESGGTRYACTGWTGEGSVPATGDTTTVGFTISTNSRLTWQWVAEHELDTVSGGNGSVDAQDGWYVAGSETTITAAPAMGYMFSNWVGLNVPPGEETSNPLTVTMDRPRTLMAIFSLAPLDLVIDGNPGPYGSPAPYGYGTNAITPDTEVTDSVGALVYDGMTRWWSDGWVGSGSVPANGDTNTVTFTITNNSALTWQWSPEYYLSNGATAGGTVTDVSGWYTNGAVVTLTATPSNGYALSHWSGDVPAGMERNGNGPDLDHSDMFGSAIGGGADWDGNGVPDLIAGAAWDDDKSLNAGAVYSLLMNPAHTVRSSAKISGTVGGGPSTLGYQSRFGTSVAVLGDVDGDGTDDVLVGAPWVTVYGSYRSGQAYVLFMNSSGQAEDHEETNPFNMIGLAPSDYFGASACPVGDMDGDGVPDVAVGAPGDPSSKAGKIYVLTLWEDGVVTWPFVIDDVTTGGPSLSVGDEFGHAVSCFANLDGVGEFDLAVGAPGDGAGAVYILFISAFVFETGDVTLDGFQEISGTTVAGLGLESDDEFGASVAVLGDLDGDSVPELAVGVPGDDDGANGAGAVFVLFLNSNGTIKAHQKISSASGNGPDLEAGDAFGASAYSGGDRDGDGVADLVVGATGDDDGDLDSGALYELFMNANGTVKSIQKISQGNNPLQVVIDGPRSITANFSKPGGIGYSPTELNVSGWDTWNPPSDTVLVWNAQSTLPMNFSVAVSNTWLSVHPSEGVSSGEAIPVRVDYSTIGVATGVYHSTINIESAEATNDTVAIPVTLTVLPTPVHYVNATNPSPQSPYMSWDTAAVTIQDAVDAASDGDTVRVADGVYDSGTRLVPGGLVSNRVVIDKAVEVRSVNGSTHTMIVGQGPVGSNAVRGVFCAEGAMLAGFTVTNGHTHWGGSGTRDQSGGGIWCESGVSISNCVLVANRAWLRGGGVYLGEVVDCTLRGNSAEHGGGVAYSTVESSVLNGNVANPGRGGGMYLSIARSSLVVGNAATTEGGGVYGSEVYNCTIVTNSALTGGGVASTKGRNAIVYGNTAGFDDNWSGGGLSYSCTVPLPVGADGTNNISEVPLFEDAASGDYRLRPSSPCLDAGVNEEWMSRARDVAGNPRVRNGTVDMGAHEFAFDLDVRVFMQGPYDTNTHAMALGQGTNGIPNASPYAADVRSVPSVPTNAVDWVLVELRGDTNSAPLVSRSVFLGADGHALGSAGFAGFNVEATPSNYYVVVKHRNHLPAMSADAIAFTNRTVFHDFTTNATLWMDGTNLAVEVESGVYGMAAGDGDGDGAVLSVDGVILETQEGLHGYHRSDYDLDGVVSNLDATVLWTQNLGRVAGIAYPETTLTAALSVDPPRRTVLAGNSIELAVPGCTGGVHWAFVRTVSGAQLSAAEGTSVVYQAGVTTTGVDVVEAWTTNDLLGRTYVNVIGLGDVAQSGKAVIITGRKGASDALWPTTRYLGDTAYDTLMYRGFSETNVHYLSPEMGEDVDLLNAWTNVQHTFTNWIEDAPRLFVYMVDHGRDSGGEGYFRLDADDELRASELDQWLDDWQDRTSNEVIVVVDCCYAGTFLDDLSYTGAASRIVIAACGDDEPTYFVAGGLISFSQAFFGNTLSALDVADAFEAAQMEMETYQAAGMIGNGTNVYIGPSTIAGLDRPVVGRVVGSQVLSGETTASLWADEVISGYPIERVWCVIVPPNYDPDPTNPVSDLTEIDLAYNQDTARYEAEYGGFGIDGIYSVAVYAMDEWRSVSLPRITSVMQTVADERVLLLVSGNTSHPQIWSAQKHLARRAYDTFTRRWFDDEHIYYLNSDTNMPHVEGPPTLANLSYAFTNWAAEATKLTVFMVGDSAGHGVWLNHTPEVLYADVLGQWLDEYQASNREAYVVMEFDASHTFFTNLVPPEERNRINIAATERGKKVSWANDGVGTFTWHFLGGVSHGETIYDAFVRAFAIVYYHSGPCGAEAYRTLPRLDDNGDGVFTMGEDGQFADTRYIGTPFLTGDEDPLIDEVTPDTLLTDTNALLLWASGVTAGEEISNVWCMVVEPGNDGQTDAPEVVLDLNEETGRHEALYTNFVKGGTYVCTFFAEDVEGRVSRGVQCNVMKPDAFEVDNDADSAQGYAIGDGQYHNIHSPTDEDWVKFFAVSGMSYSVETIHWGTNANTALQVYQRQMGGSLTPVSPYWNLGWTGIGEGEAIPFNPIDSGMYYVRVTPGSASCWGLETEYDLKIRVPVGAEGHLMVAALDVVDAQGPPPGSYAEVVGQPVKYFNNENAVFFEGLEEGTYEVRVVVPAGYLPVEDPLSVGGVTDPDERNIFGNPKTKEVDAYEFHGCAFMFYPMGGIEGVVRDGHTGGRLDDARISMSARSGTIEGSVYTSYQNLAWADLWETDGDGVLPDDEGSGGILVPGALGDLKIVCEGYEDCVYSNMFGGEMPDGGFYTNLGVVFMSPVDADGDGIADAWSNQYSVAGGTNDTDNDGLNDDGEYYAGTDPTNAGSGLWFDGGVSNTAEGFVVEWPSVPWRTYRVRGTDDLMGPAPWPWLSEEMEATQNQYRMYWTDTNAVYRSGMFYGVDVIVP